MEGSGVYRSIPSEAALLKEVNLDLLYDRQTTEVVRKQRAMMTEKGNTNLRKHEHSLKDYFRENRF